MTYFKIAFLTELKSIFCSILYVILQCICFCYKKHIMIRKTTCKYFKKTNKVGIIYNAVLWSCASKCVLYFFLVFLKWHKLQTNAKYIQLFTTISCAEYYTENRRNTCKTFWDFYDKVTYYHVSPRGQRSYNLAHLIKVTSLLGPFKQ